MCHENLSPNLKDENGPRLKNPWTFRCAIPFVSRPRQQFLAITPQAVYDYLTQGVSVKTETVISADEILEGFKRP